MAPVHRGSAAASIADRIDLVRTEMELTQEEFAEAIGVTRSHLASIETYRIEPSLAAIIGVLCFDLRVGTPVRQIDPTWLLLGEDFEQDMYGKLRIGLRRSMESDDLLLMVDRAQHGVPQTGSE